MEHSEIRPHLRDDKPARAPSKESADLSQQFSNQADSPQKKTMKELLIKGLLKKLK